MSETRLRSGRDAEPPAGAARRGGRRKPEFSWARLAAFVALCGLGNLWFSVHVGASLTQVGSQLLVASGVAAVLKLLNKAEIRTLKDLLRRLLLLCVRPATLTVLFIACLSLSFVSSWRVTCGDGDSVGDAELIADLDLQTPAGVFLARRDRRAVEGFTLVVPYGRSVWLSVPGYEPRSLRLYPWEKRVVSAKELDALPTLLLRPPYPVLKARDGAVLSVERIVGQDRQTIACCHTDADHGAVLLKGPRPVPEKTLDDWRGAWEKPSRRDETPPELALRLWSSWKEARLIQPIREGDTIEAQYVTQASKRVACIRYTITSDDYQDVALLEECP